MRRKVEHVYSTKRMMDIESIKSKVKNYEACSIEDIDDILNFIADRKKQELGIDFEFETVYEEGGRIKPERTADGHQQVEIGEWPLAEIKGNKDLGLETDSIEERKEFIELILQTFHELRHVKQNDNIQDHPISNEETLKMTREHIINESFWGFRNRFNYEQSMVEIDAVKTSLEETVSFFQEMGSDITPDEVFAVMREKELSYLDYDLQEFGDSYETAMSHFNQIYGKTTDIKGITDIIQSLPEDKKAIFYSQCQDLMESYNTETDIEKKMELLKEMSLRMTPELREQYPLANRQTEKNEETGYRLATVNGKNILELDNKATKKEGEILDGVGKVTKPIFEQALLLAGFRPDTIARLKSSIQMVSPRALLTMDNILGRTKEQTLSRGGNEDGNERDDR